MNPSNQGKTFLSALRAHIHAFRWIYRQNHQVWFLYAAAISVGLIGLNYWGAQLLHERLETLLLEFVNGWTQDMSSENSLLLRMKEGARDVLLASFDVVFWVFTFWLKIKITKYLVLACVGPLMAYLSEQAESEVRGIKYSFHLWSSIQDFARSLGVALICFATELGISFLLLVLIGLSWLFVPLAAPAVVLVLGGTSSLVSAFFYGLTVFDPIWERKGLGIRLRIKRAFSMKASVLGAGLPFHLWMSIPFVSAVISPIVAPVLCAVAAVLICDQRGWEDTSISR